METPQAVNPREGRGDVRNFSSGGGSAVPRSVSSVSHATGGADDVVVGMAVSTTAHAF